MIRLYQYVDSNGNGVTPWLSIEEIEKLKNKKGIPQGCLRQHFDFPEVEGERLFGPSVGKNEDDPITEGPSAFYAKGKMLNGK